MAKVTLQKIARLADVGTATVERVLNGRGGVRPEMAERVLKAAQKLDYPKRIPAQHHGVIRIEVLLLQPELTFISRLARSFERISGNLDRSIAVHRTLMAGDDPQAVARHILDPDLRRSALIVALPEHPVIRDALLAVRARGVTVVQVMTRMEGLNAPFVGIDNRAAGRMAGLLMSGLQRERGAIAALCHSQIYAVHRERLEGFSDYMSRRSGRAHDFRFVGFTFDRAEDIAQITARLMADVPDLAGLYVIGGDYGPLCDFLRAKAVRPAICVIGHELSDQNATALREGTISAIIDQAPETQARRALDTALDALGMLKTAVDQTPIRFLTITAENL